MDNYNGRTKTDIEGNKDFNKLAQLTGDNIQKIIQNVSSMNKIVMQLNRTQDAAHIKQNLRKISNYTQQLTKDTSHNLKELYKIRHSSQTEQMQFKIHKERLAERFKSALSEFEAVQCKVYDKENELMKLTKLSESTKILHPPSSSNHHNDYSTFKSNKNNQTQFQIQYSVDTKTIQRQQDVLQLENDVKDIHDVYREFSKHVEILRETVYWVEENVLDTESLINEGNTYLYDASQYKNKFRKRSCYLSVICTVIILIIIYYVFIK